MMLELINKQISFSKKNFKKIILYSILIFAFIKPDSLEYIGLKWLDTLLILIDSTVMVVLFLFLITKKYRISNCSIIILLIYISIGVCTIFGQKDYFSLLKVAGTSFGFALFTDFMLQRNPDIYFKASITTLIILFSINFITIIIYYPTGMYEMEKIVGDLYFMGHDNGMIYNLIPLSALSLLYAYLKKGKFVTWYTICALFLLFASVIYVQSATGIIEGILLLLLVFMYDNKYLSRIIKPSILIFIYLLFNVLIVFMRIQNYFSWFIVDMLGKDLTFTGRTILWDYTIYKVMKNHFMGYGTGVVIPGTNNHTYPHCHNLLLDFLFKGGIFALIFFILLLCVFSKYYYRVVDKKIAKLILIPLFILLFGEITSAVPYKIYFWSFFVLIQYANEIKAYYEIRRKQI